jgi:outer membrane autotransporter protein
MKKIAIASLLALAAISASAVEVGVTAARDYAGADRDAYGVTVGQSFGKFGVTGGFDRATKGANNQDRYTVIGSYDVTKLGSATVAVKGGAAYLDNQTTKDGYAFVAGVGISVPVASKVSLGLDYTRQEGQKRVDAFNGDRLTASVKYAF